jgi:hypothetical protein
MKTLRQYIRQIILESQENVPTLGAFVYKHKDEICGVIYDVTVARDNVEKIMNANSTEELNSFMIDQVIKGYVVVGPQILSRCDDSWMVYKSAGPGYGREVYGLGYSLSPTGKLSPDRESVSRSAQFGWAAQVGKRPSTQFDDMSHSHDMPGNEYHTDDTADDCQVYQHGDDEIFVPPEVLNRSYERVAQDSTLAKTMTMNHETFMKELPKPVYTEFTNMLPWFGRHFFRVNYRRELDAGG